MRPIHIVPNREINLPDINGKMENAATCQILQGYEIKRQVTGFERRVVQTETPNNVSH